MIRVAVAGAAGRMGQTVCAAVEGADDMELTGRADPALDTAVADVLGDADVLVDFTQPDQALGNAREALAAGVHVVIGTTGLRPGRACATRPRRRAAKAFFAPNFAIGAVLMMRFAAEASRHHGARRDRRAAPPRQARRAVGHRRAHRRDDGGRRADPLRPPAGPRRRPGGHPRRRRADAHDPPRHDRPHELHARRAARDPRRGGAARAASRSGSSTSCGARSGHRPRRRALRPARARHARPAHGDRRAGGGGDPGRARRAGGARRAARPRPCASRRSSTSAWRTARAAS